MGKGSINRIPTGFIACQQVHKREGYARFLRYLERGLAGAGFMPTLIAASVRLRIGNGDHHAISRRPLVPPGRTSFALLRASSLRDGSFSQGV
ncbi:MAG: hypothetical protein ISS61_03960 [Desulfobacteraceae bacterium]|nr:hypothetical protein [Desulfobacteraceae bacterium]